ncbi:MAG TPA: hypothetical protein VHS78_10385 [Candidatus Elarobacter sp.]|jgi:hypothetical protein|nr:hypothetical protein [Candidatus Elarobacter sp.]
MLRARVTVCAAALALSVSVAACGGTGGADSLPAICPQIATSVFTSGTLISPPNGATGVSPNLGKITFTASSPDLQGTAPGTVVTLTPSNGAPAVQQPDSVITTNNVSSSVIPTLHGATTYTVTVSATPYLPGSAVCQGLVTATLGSFTTQ